MTRRLLSFTAVCVLLLHGSFAQPTYDEDCVAVAEMLRWVPVPVWVTVANELLVAVWVPVAELLGVGEFDAVPGPQGYGWGMKPTGGVDTVQYRTFAPQ